VSANGAGVERPVPELRIDPLTGLRTILAPAGEVLVPAREGERPLTEPPPRPGANASRDLFWSAPALGAHERLEDPAQPLDPLAQLSAEQLELAVERWRERMRAHADAACLHLTVSDRGDGPRPVAVDLYALPFVPAQLARERERFAAYATRTMGGNALADLVQEEVRQRERIVAIDDEAVCMAPYASRVPFQLMIAPRLPRPRFEEEGPSGARLLHGVLGKLARVLGSSPALTLWVRTAPRGAEHYCWRIDVLPGARQPGGLELGAGLSVNELPPELAAARLREA